MGLVDGEEGDGYLLQQLDGLLLREGLGSHIEQLGAALEQVVLDLVLLHAREGGVEKVGHVGGARGIAHGVDLVLHQRDEGRHDDGRALEYHRRQLVAEALAAAGGHDDEGVVPVQQALDDGLLVAFELVETEYLF